MDTSRPLLMFPPAKSIRPLKGQGFPQKNIHVPVHEKQVARLREPIKLIEQQFQRYKASISHSVAGLEPETVLVIEIVGTVDKFKQAVEKAGLEWLGEWDVDDIPPDENFHEFDDKEKPTEKKFKGNLFLSLVNQAGMNDLLSLFEKWKKNEKLPRGKTKWRDLFNQMIEIRPWGMEDSLKETGMLDAWREDLRNPIHPDEPVFFQIELFYRKSEDKRRQVETKVGELLEKDGGCRPTSRHFIYMPDIAFHAVKTQLPARSIEKLLSDLDCRGWDTDIELFRFPGIMYVRPTGQSLAVSEDGEGVDTDIAEGALTGHPPIDLPPIAAILDGVPNVQHQVLKGRVLLDDPDNLSSQYQPGGRKHGTAMASMAVHGDLSSEKPDPLPRPVYVVPIMQPDPKSSHNPENISEHVPKDVFLEDRIHCAVRRMFSEGTAVPAQAPDVCIINLSIGDPARPFIRTPSPLARLLDWLAWKYRVLFCVSAGNYSEDIDIARSGPAFRALPNREKIGHVLSCIQGQLSRRRILSPAESLNAITVGALHADNSPDYVQGQRTDLLPGASFLFSPISRLGHGFRRSIKPDIYFPGGRQLYKTPMVNSETVYKIDEVIAPPGQQVASDSKQSGELSKTAYRRGTSNATALATHGAARIYEVLDSLFKEQETNIPREYISLLVKALLVHGAKQDNKALHAITHALKISDNARRFKEVTVRYLGYGAVQLERVLTCTAQRGTVLDFGKISEGQRLEYRLPLPPDLSSRREWRRMIVTLAWFSPVNPYHRNFREARLKMQPARNWPESPLKLARQDGDHHQVTRGTVQHEVLEGKKQIEAFQDGKSISLHITCKKDATEHLDEAIPYGLAVTLEVKDDTQIPIYEQLRTRLQPKVAVDAI